MAQYRVEAWSLKSPAARHEDRVLTATVTVEAKTEDEARIVAAREAGIPRDYWDGVRASAVGLRTAIRYRKGTRGEKVPETVIVGHIPFVLLRVEAARGKGAPKPRTPFNAPHMRLAEAKAKHEDAQLERRRGL